MQQMKVVAALKTENLNRTLNCHLVIVSVHSVHTDRNKGLAGKGSCS